MKIVEKLKLSLACKWLVSSVLIGCSALRASPADTSPFLEHADLLKPWYDRAPWDAVWSSDPGKIMVKSQQVRKIYISQIDTEYLNKKKDPDGKEVETKTVPAEDIQAMTDLLHQKFTDAVRNKPETNLQIVDSKNDANLVLQIALIELIPTKISENIIADAGGLIPAAKAIEEASVIGGQAAGGALAAGSIAIEFKICDAKSGKILAEAKDREADPASIVPNFRDFHQFGWSRKTAQDWAEQFAEIFSTPVTERIDPASDISFKPW